MWGHHQWSHDFSLFLRLDRIRKRAKFSPELGQNLLDGVEEASALPVCPQSSWGATAPVWMMWPKSMGGLEIWIIWCVCVCSTSLTTISAAWGPHQRLCCPPDPRVSETLLLIWLPLPPPLAFASPRSVSCCALHKLPYLLGWEYQFMLLVLLVCREKTRWKSLAVEVWPVKVCAGEETAISLCPVKSHPEIKVNRPSAGSELHTL